MSPWLVAHPGDPPTLYTKLNEMRNPAFQGFSGVLKGFQELIVAPGIDSVLSLTSCSTAFQLFQLFSVSTLKSLLTEAPKHRLPKPHHTSMHGNPE